MDFFEFDERGAHFELQPPCAGRGILLMIRPTDGDIEVHEVRDLEDAGRAVDRFLDRLPPATAGEGFQGYLITYWDHEAGMDATAKYATRGSLLGWFDNGHLPTPDGIADAKEWCGDLTLTVSDGNGQLLLDRTAATREKIRLLETQPGPLNF